MKKVLCFVIGHNYSNKCFWRMKGKTLITYSCNRCGKLSNHCGKIENL